MNCKIIPNLAENLFVEGQTYIDEDNKPKNGLNKVNVSVLTKTELRLPRLGEGKKLKHRSSPKVENFRLNAEVNFKNDKKIKYLQNYTKLLKNILIRRR